VPQSLSPADLDRYLARIGFAGERPATLATLNALHALHPAAIPFENLDVLLGREIRLDLPSLVDKLVARRRGGYCFEHNTLFAAALGAIGFEVETLGARPMWRYPSGEANARTHMALKVVSEGVDYLADAGFGGNTLTAPLLLRPDIVQDTPHGRYRLVRDGGEMRLDALTGTEWEPVYLVSREPRNAMDWEVANWFTSTSPQSRFRKQLMAARARPGMRCTLLDNRLSVHRPDGVQERRHLCTAAQLAAALEEVFGIDIPEGSGALIGELAGRG